MPAKRAKRLDADTVDRIVAFAVRARERETEMPPPDGPADPCPACGEERYWRSRFGARTCRRCHPPACAELEA